MPGPTDNPIREVLQTVEQDRAEQIAGERQGRTSLFTCPECGGTLWQVNEPEFVQFLCHVGHALAGEALFQKQTEAAENALWYAIRTLTDKSVLGRQLAASARQRGEEGDASGFEERAAQAEREADALRKIAEA